MNLLNIVHYTKGVEDIIMTTRELAKIVTQISGGYRSPSYAKNMRLFKAAADITKRHLVEQYQNAAKKEIARLESMNYQVPKYLSVLANRDLKKSYSQKEILAYRNKLAVSNLRDRAYMQLNYTGKTSKVTKEDGELSLTKGKITDVQDKNYRVKINYRTAAEDAAKLLNRTSKNVLKYGKGKSEAADNIITMYQNLEIVTGKQLLPSNFDKADLKKYLPSNEKLADALKNMQSNLGSEEKQAKWFERAEHFARNMNLKFGTNEGQAGALWDTARDIPYKTWYEGKKAGQKFYDEDYKLNQIDFGTAGNLRQLYEPLFEAMDNQSWEFYKMIYGSDDFLDGYYEIIQSPEIDQDQAVELFNLYMMQGRSPMEAIIAARKKVEEIRRSNNYAEERNTLYNEVFS